MEDNTFYEETLEMLNKNYEKYGDDVVNEAKRLLKSGAIDKNYHSRSMLLKAAYNNIADSYFLGNPQDYINLRKF